MQTELTDQQRRITIVFIIGFGIILGYFLGYFSAILITLYLLGDDKTTFLYTSAVTSSRDIKFYYRFFLGKRNLEKWIKENVSLSDVFEKICLKHPAKSAMIMNDDKLTFSEGNRLSNEIASYFREQGLKKGDSVALLMETKIQYPFIWIGLSKIGVPTALINFNLRKDALIHSVTTVNSKVIIVSAELKDALEEIRDHPGIKGLPVYQYNEKTERDFLAGAKDLRAELESVSIQTSFPDPTFNQKDKLLYIFTSGTTGLPKAAVVTHVRFLLVSTMMFYVEGVRTSDIIYNPLPLYHSAGGMVGIGNVLVYGITMVVRRKFSATNYWTDCSKYNCTIGQYVGELCRYLLARPQSPVDKQHKVRLMFGNGIRPQIWNQFVERFGVHQLGEMYGATEGNCTMINIAYVPGSCGFVPKLMSDKFPIALIKCNDDGEPIRDSDGRCTRCKAGEPGLIIGKIDMKDPARAFYGYSDEKASQKKILRDVFKVGDVYFNSGDVLVRDIFNNFFFKDRTGDTFRWCGENVSTTEVEGIVSNVAGLKDCTVYGVTVPHTEGNAGMAAILDPDNQLDMEKLSVGIKAALPSYARPVFIRVMPELPMTSTFKVVKKDLLKDGFDFHVIKDPMYLLNKDGTYRKMTETDYDKIMNGTAGL